MALAKDTEMMKLPRGVTRKQIEARSKKAATGNNLGWVKVWHLNVWWSCLSSDTVYYNAGSGLLMKRSSGSLSDHEKPLFFHLSVQGENVVQYNFHNRLIEKTRL